MYKQTAIGSNIYRRLNDHNKYFLYDSVNDIFIYKIEDFGEYEFDINGNLSAIRNLSGNEITFYYEENSNNEPI